MKQQMEEVEMEKEYKWKSWKSQVYHREQEYHKNISSYFNKAQYDVTYNFYYPSSGLVGAVLIRADLEE